MSAAAAKTTTKTGIIWNIVCALACIVLIPFIICSVYLSIETRKNPDKLATIFGEAPVIVLSGSMEPVFEVNDVIFIEEVDVSTLKAKEDIICFYDDGQFITHRISRIVVEEGETRFYTMGDFNGVEDKDYVVAEQIQGKYTGRIPKLGAVILFIQDPYGLVLTMILLLLLYITGELIIEILEKRKLNKQLLIEIERLRALLAEKEVFLGEREALIIEQGKTLTAKEEELIEWQVRLDEQVRCTAEKEERLLDKDGVIADKNAWIEEQEGLLAERESRIAALEKLLIEKEEWIAAFLPPPEVLPAIVLTETPSELPQEEILDEQATEEVAVSQEAATIKPTKLRKIKPRLVRILSIHDDPPPKEDDKQIYAKFKKE